MSHKISFDLSEFFINNIYTFVVILHGESTKQKFAHFVRDLGGKTDTRKFFIPSLNKRNLYKVIFNHHDKEIFYAIYIMSDRLKFIF